MSNGIDYSSVEVPDDEPPESFSWQARRAELLRFIERAGHPRLVNQSRLAERYGCTRQNINHDMDVLAEYVEDNLGAHHTLVSKNVFDRCIRELLEEGEWRKAVQSMKDMNDWLAEKQEREEMLERIEELESLARDAEHQPMTAGEEWR